MLCCLSILGNLITATAGVDADNNDPVLVWVCSHACLFCIVLVLFWFGNFTVIKPLEKTPEDLLAGFCGGKIDI